MSVCCEVDNINIQELDLTSFKRRNDVAENVRQSIVNQPSLTREQLAMQLRISPRTLHRYLSKGGTSFKKLHNEVRMDMAVKYLQQNELPVKKIAYLLGFSDGSNFHTFFKKWCSQSPNEYRREFLNRI